MSKTKRSWTFLLALAMLLSLCACGKQESEEQPELVVIGQPQVSSQTEPGYVTELRQQPGSPRGDGRRQLRRPSL